MSKPLLPSTTALTFSCLLTCIALCNGHGMMMDPPNRSSLWRFDPTAPPNYDDNQNYCGGRRDICGVCGDPYSQARPRDNENTGKYGQGKIVKDYPSGSVFTASILLTTNHIGWFEFSICKLVDRSQPEPEDCFRPIMLANGKDKYVVPSHDDGYFKVDLKLPEGLSCEQCVLRWHYRTGNTWGKCDDGTYAMGCGPQEIFRSCTDISIH